MAIIVSSQKPTTEVTENEFEKLCESMPRRCQLVIERKLAGQQNIDTKI